MIRGPPLSTLLPDPTLCRCRADRAQPAPAHGRRPLVARQPEGPPPPPTVQKLRLRYAKSGPLRFASHRDLARALERALRRARVPTAFSAGFSPHPKDSYVRSEEHTSELQS